MEFIQRSEGPGYDVVRAIKLRPTPKIDGRNIFNLIDSSIRHMYSPAAIKTAITETVDVITGREKAILERANEIAKLRREERTRATKLHRSIEIGGSRGWVS